MCRNGLWGKGCGKQPEIVNCADIAILPEKTIPTETQTMKVVPWKAPGTSSKPIKQTWTSPRAKLTSIKPTIRPLFTLRPTATERQPTQEPIIPTTTYFTPTPTNQPITRPTPKRPVTMPLTSPRTIPDIVTRVIPEVELTNDPGVLTPFTDRTVNSVPSITPVVTVSGLSKTTDFENLITDPVTPRQQQVVVQTTEQTIDSKNLMTDPATPRQQVVVQMTEQIIPQVKIVNNNGDTETQTVLDGNGAVKIEAVTIEINQPTTTPYQKPHATTQHILEQSTGADLSTTSQTLIDDNINSQSEVSSNTDTANSVLVMSTSLAEPSTGPNNALMTETITMSNALNVITTTSPSVTANQENIVDTLSETTQIPVELTPTTSSTHSSGSVEDTIVKKWNTNTVVSTPIVMGQTTFYSDLTTILTGDWTGTTIPMSPLVTDINFITDIPVPLKRTGMSTETNDPTTVINYVARDINATSSSPSKSDTGPASETSTVYARNETNVKVTTPTPYVSNETLGTAVISEEDSKTTKVFILTSENTKDTVTVTDSTSATSTTNSFDIDSTSIAQISSTPKAIDPNPTVQMPSDVSGSATIDKTVTNYTNTLTINTMTANNEPGSEGFQSNNLLLDSNVTPPEQNVPIATTPSLPLFIQSSETSISSPVNTLSNSSAIHLVISVTVVKNETQSFGKIVDNVDSTNIDSNNTVISVNLDLGGFGGIIPPTKTNQSGAFGSNSSTAYISENNNKTVVYSSNSTKKIVYSNLGSENRTPANYPETTTNSKIDPPPITPHTTNAIEIKGSQFTNTDTYIDTSRNVIPIVTETVNVQQVTSTPNINTDFRSENSFESIQSDTFENITVDHLVAKLDETAVNQQLFNDSITHQVSTIKNTTGFEQPSWEFGNIVKSSNVHVVDNGSTHIEKTADLNETTLTTGNQKVFNDIITHQKSTITKTTEYEQPSFEFGNILNTSNVAAVDIGSSGIGQTANFNETTLTTGNQNMFNDIITHEITIITKTTEYEQPSFEFVNILNTSNIAVAGHGNSDIEKTFDETMLNRGNQQLFNNSITHQISTVTNTTKYEQPSFEFGNIINTSNVHVVNNGSTDIEKTADFNKTTLTTGNQQVFNDIITHQKSTITKTTTYEQPGFEFGDILNSSNIAVAGNGNSDIEMTATLDETTLNTGKQQLFNDSITHQISTVTNTTKYEQPSFEFVNILNTSNIADVGNGSSVIGQTNIIIQNVTVNENVGLTSSLNQRTVENKSKSNSSTFTMHGNTNKLVNETVSKPSSQNVLLFVDGMLDSKTMKLLQWATDQYGASILNNSLLIELQSGLLGLNTPSPSSIFSEVTNMNSSLSDITNNITTINSESTSGIIPGKTVSIDKYATDILVDALAELERLKLMSNSSNQPHIVARDKVVSNENTTTNMSTDDYNQNVMALNGSLNQQLIERETIINSSELISSIGTSYNDYNDGFINDSNLVISDSNLDSHRQKVTLNTNNANLAGNRSTQFIIDINIQIQPNDSRSGVTELNAIPNGPQPQTTESLNNSLLSVLMTETTDQPDTIDVDQQLSLADIAGNMTMNSPFQDVTRNTSRQQELLETIMLYDAKTLPKSENKTSVVKNSHDGSQSSAIATINLKINVRAPDKASSETDERIPDSFVSVLTTDRKITNGSNDQSNRTVGGKAKLHNSTSLNTEIIINGRKDGKFNNSLSDEMDIKTNETVLRAIGDSSLDIEISKPTPSSSNTSNKTLTTHISDNEANAHESKTTIPGSTLKSSITVNITAIVSDSVTIKANMSGIKPITKRLELTVSGSDLQSNLSEPATNKSEITYNTKGLNTPETVLNDDITNRSNNKLNMSPKAGATTVYEQGTSSTVSEKVSNLPKSTGTLQTIPQRSINSEVSAIRQTSSMKPKAVVAKDNDTAAPNLLFSFIHDILGRGPSRRPNTDVLRLGRIIKILD